MAFIRTQRVRWDGEGRVESGSAAIVDSEYVRTGRAAHSRQVTRERLGRVLWLSGDGRSGVFASPTRGVVEYDADSDSFGDVAPEDPRVASLGVFPEPERHVVFGDAYLLLEFLRSTGVLGVLRGAFPGDEAYGRVLCHVLHGVLRDGSRIGCDDFTARSLMSLLVRDVPLASLGSDTRFFTLMGGDGARMAFFRGFAERMRRADPMFGRGCYVDSTPLPNDIVGNPFNALCRHGVSSPQVMTRLVLVLDEATGLPVWYDVIPGNVLDVGTVMGVVGDVADSIGVTIDSLVLDAGYASADLIRAFHNGTGRTMITRMPARRGYPHDELYRRVRDQIGKGRYAFARNHHTYFGRRFAITLFDQPINAYVYVDRTNATQKFADWLTDHPDEFDSMTLRDKDWATVRYGFFVLLSNTDAEPADLLDRYYGRTSIETAFKTGKEYLGLLPLAKWTDTTVRGKILHDIIDTAIRLTLVKRLAGTNTTVTDLIGRTQSLMCHADQHGTSTSKHPTSKSGNTTRRSA